MNTRASYHFAADDRNPATVLFTPFDGYPSGAALFLREMLLQTGISGAGAFQRANQRSAFVTEDVSGGLGTSYRYHLDGMQLVAEERALAGSGQWNPVFTGALVDFIHANNPDPMLHATGERAEGGVRFSTVPQLEMYLAEAQGEAIRYEAGVFAVAGATAAERVEELRAQVLAALRAELLAERAEAGNYEPVLKRFTVIAEIWDNEQGYAATVSAKDADEAIEMVLAKYRAAAAKARGEEAADESEEDEDEDGEDGLLRIWAVVEGAPDVVYTRDAD